MEEEEQGQLQSFFSFVTMEQDLQEAVAEAVVEVVVEDMEDMEVFPSIENLEK